MCYWRVCGSKNLPDSKSSNVHGSPFYRFTEEDMVFPYLPSADDISRLIAEITPSFEVDRKSTPSPVTALYLNRVKVSVIWLPGRGVEDGTHYHTTTFYTHHEAYKAFTDPEERSEWLEEKYDAKTVLEMVTNVDISHQTSANIDSSTRMSVSNG